MPPRPRPTCVVCRDQPSRYTCASCSASYCSVACYNPHKETCSSAATRTPDISASAPPVASAPEPAPGAPMPTAIDVDNPETLQDPPPLRPLTSLEWPYVPDTSAYPNPLTRDDPKPLQLDQYEALATSPVIRTILRSNPRLCDLLTSINALRGAEREEALQRALGVDSRQLKNDDAGAACDEDTKTFRKFAEAVEVAVRGGREDVLGLDWD